MHKKKGLDCLEMCLRGEEEAWAYVYNMVLGICRWPRWNLRDSAEDLAQAIVLFLLEKGLKECREKPSFRAFVRKVAFIRYINSVFQGYYTYCEKEGGYYE